MQIVEGVYPSGPTTAVNQNDTKAKTPSIAFPAREAPVATLAWHEKAILHINAADQKLEEHVPNFEFQNRLDALGATIKNTFAPLKAFTDWLDTNGNGAWYEQLGLFLAKLPLRVAHNIVRLLYSIVETALYAAVHPLKAVTNLARFLVLLAVELTKPGIWSKMGVGILGGSCGQLLVTGNPLALIGIGIGGAISIGGITAGAVKAAIDGGKDAVKENLLAQAKELPDALLTGFCMGLLFGAIQRAMTPAQPVTQPASSEVIIRPRTVYQAHALEASNPPAVQLEGVRAQDLIKFANDCFEKGKHNLFTGAPVTRTPEELLQIQAEMAKLEELVLMGEKLKSMGGISSMAGGLKG